MKALAAEAPISGKHPLLGGCGKMVLVQSTCPRSVQVMPLGTHDRSLSDRKDDVQIVASKKSPMGNGNSWELVKVDTD